MILTYWRLGLVFRLCSNCGVVYFFIIIVKGVGFCLNFIICALDITVLNVLHGALQTSLLAFSITPCRIQGGGGEY
jgi:hypothetical protein